MVMRRQGQPAKKKNGALEVRKMIKAQTERKQPETVKSALRRKLTNQTIKERQLDWTKARKTLQERKAQKAGQKRGKL